jgi:hypothetical protein
MVMGLDALLFAQLDYPSGWFPASIIGSLHHQQEVTGIHDYGGGDNHQERVMANEFV